MKGQTEVIHQKNSEKNDAKRRVLTATFTWVALLIICGIALFLRVYFPQHSVIRDGVTYFKENDPWYHVRLVENLLRHFPHRITFDPYTYFPYGQAVFFAPLFDLLLGLVILIVSLGHPTPEIIRTVSLYYPAVLGVLVIPPVYFIGKELFDRRAGLLAAFIVGIMPSMFLTRSLMGFTDHHVAEVLLSTVTILFLILALKRGSETGASFADIGTRHWKKVREPLMYVLLTGVFLAMYLLAWTGGFLLVFMLFSAFFAVYLIDYLRGKSVDFVVVAGSLTFFIALILIMPFLGQLPFANLCVPSLVGGTLVLPGLYLVSRLSEKKGLSRFYYPLILTGIGAVGIASLYLVDKSVFLDVIGTFRRFTPNTGLLTVSEARPLFYSGGSFSWAPAWEEFRSGLFLAPIAFVVIVWKAFKKASPQIWLFITWCIVMLAATLAQIRFSYYFTVNVALLSAYFVWQTGILIHHASERVLLKNYRREQQRLMLSERPLRHPAHGNKPQSPTPGEIPVKITRKKNKPRWPSFVSYVLIAAVIGSLIIYPNYEPDIAVASNLSGPSKDWYDALVWLRDKSPEPFSDPDFFYKLYEKPASGIYPYPPSAYGVMSWWDYGHWITEIAHRIPNANPHQRGAVDAATFFTAQDEEAGKKVLDKLGSRYVVIDLEMALPCRVSGESVRPGKFYAFAAWTNGAAEDYFDIYYKRDNGKFEQMPLYHEAYYQSMCARLYSFQGEEWTPRNSTVVVSWAERSGFKEIVSEQTFVSYEEAKTFISEQTGSNWRIVGKNPFISPVPLKKLEHFRCVYHSDTWAVKFGEDRPVAYAVEIYRYTP